MNKTIFFLVFYTNCIVFADPISENDKSKFMYDRFYFDGNTLCKLDTKRQLQKCIQLSDEQKEKYKKLLQQKEELEIILLTAFLKYHLFIMKHLQLEIETIEQLDKSQVNPLQTFDPALNNVREKYLLDINKIFRNAQETLEQEIKQRADQWIDENPEKTIRILHKLEILDEYMKK